MYTVMFGVLFDRCVFEASITALFASLMVAGKSVRESGPQGLGRESTEVKYQ